jgi:hypothetical protein
VELRAVRGAGGAARMDAALRRPRHDGAPLNARP